MIPTWELDFGSRVTSSVLWHLCMQLLYIDDAMELQSHAKNTLPPDHAYDTTRTVPEIRQPKWQLPSVLRIYSSAAAKFCPVSQAWAVIPSDLKVNENLNINLILGLIVTSRPLATHHLQQIMTDTDMFDNNYGEWLATKKMLPTIMANDGYKKRLIFANNGDWYWWIIFHN